MSVFVRRFETHPSTARLSAVIGAAAMVAVLLVPAAASASTGLLGQIFDQAGGQSASADASGMSVKGSVEEYTWDELSAIADAISASGDKDAALAIAEQYNLCTPDGLLDGTQTKSITLSDGTQTAVAIAGFYHDTVSTTASTNGTAAPAAGITFIFTDAIAQHAMNSNASSAGGWEASEMRTWMNADLIAMMPEDLQKDIVAVDKLTNNVGQTADTSSITATSDKLWLFSATELAGRTYRCRDDVSYGDDILNAEGTQYQLFNDQAVVEGYVNDVLMRGFAGSVTQWWERSSIPYMANTFGATHIDGGSDSFGQADATFGVVPGFCLGTSDVPAGVPASEAAQTPEDVRANIASTYATIWLSGFTIENGQAIYFDYTQNMRKLRQYLEPGSAAYQAYLDRGYGTIYFRDIVSSIIKVDVTQIDTYTYRADVAEVSYQDPDVVSQEKFDAAVADGGHVSSYTFTFDDNNLVTDIERNS